MFPVKITTLEERPPDASIRAWRKIGSDAHAEMGEHWHREFLPLHFRPSAFARYGYQERTKKYNIRKLWAVRRGKSQGGPDTPLVYSGVLRESMTRVGTIRAYPSRVTISMVGPRYISMRPYQSNQPDKGAEVTKTTQDEQIDLAEVLEKKVADGLNALRAPRTTTNS